MDKIPDDEGKSVGHEGGEHHSRQARQWGQFMGNVRTTAGAATIESTGQVL